jgi:hypothetical protein
MPQSKLRRYRVEKKEYFILDAIGENNPPIHHQGQNYRYFGVVTECNERGVLPIHHNRFTLQWEDHTDNMFMATDLAKKIEELEPLGRLVIVSKDHKGQLTEVGEVTVEDALTTVNAHRAAST